MRSSDHELSVGTVPAKGPEGGSQQKTQAKYKRPLIELCSETEEDTPNHTTDSDKETDLRELVSTGEESWVGHFFQRHITWVFRLHGS